MSKEIFDVAVIGGGPAGMMAAFYAGTRGLKPIVIDILDRFGGQCQTLYPEKAIYDIAGHPATTGAGLISHLKNQLDQVQHEVLFNTQIENLKRDVDSEGRDIWVLHTTNNSVIMARTVVIAVGKGAFEPRKLNVKGEDLKGVFYTVQSLDEFNGHDVVIVGGGDSAFDWSMALKDRAKSLTHIHRSDQYRAHGQSVNIVKEAGEKGDIALMPFWEITEIVGNFQNKIESVTIRHNKTGEEKQLNVSRIIISAGFLTNLGKIHDWGIHIEHEKIIVDPTKGYSTNLPGIFAIGDIAHFEGKVELITTSFGEAATTAFYAYKTIHGEIKGAAWCAKLPA